MFPSVFLTISIDMNQQQPFPDGSQVSPDGQQYQQQQPQWQPQQQPMPGIQMQQPQPQYVQMPAETPPMTMQMPTQNGSTPQLDAMYSQGGPQQYGQPAQQENLGHSQQGFVQQPQDFVQQPQDFVQQPQGFVQQPQGLQNNDNNGEQMQQAPQNFVQQIPAQEYHQSAQFDPSMNLSGQPGQFSQGQPLQQQAAPQAGYQFGPEGGGQPAWSGSQAANTGNVASQEDDSAWEQAHVTEVNDTAGFNYQPSGHSPPISQQQQQNQAIRERELHDARQRIGALEAEREQHEIMQALAASARDAPDSAEIEEQLQQQIHQAQLLSLDAWEQEVRWKIQEQRQGGNGQPGIAYDGGSGGGSWQRQPLAPPSHLVSDFSDPRRGAALHGPAPSMQRGHMPPPSNSSARGSISNLGFRSPTPRSQTPTRGVPISDAARNASTEEAQRWAAYHRNLNAHDGASVSAGTEYTDIPEYSEASTARGGPKGKGRTSREGR
jgi:hypothetical protein